MRIRRSLICFFTGFSLLTACSTPTKKRNSLIAEAAGLGAVIGAATAPEDERQDVHAAYWAAILGVGAAIAGNYLYNDEIENETLRKENQKLKADLDLFQTGQKVLLDQGNGKFKNPEGNTELNGQKAHWKVYQVDRWSREGAHQLNHQDKMVEITPLEKAP